MATVGETAPSQNTVNYDALLSTTLANYRGTMVDNIFKEHATLSYLKMSGAKETQDGGERVAQPLMYEENSTFNTHSGYEEIETTPQDGMTTAFMEWAEVAGSITISRKEERQNSGEGRILNLLKQKTIQAEMSMAEYLNESLILGKVSSATFVPNTSRGGVQGIAPIPYWIRKAPLTDPVAGGNCGNISASSNTWWCSRSADASSTKPTGGTFGLSVTTYAGLLVALRRQYNYCSRGGGGSPDLCITDQVSYETYENAMDTKVRYTNTKFADMGFDNIKLRGATCIWDEKTPDLENGTEAITTGTWFFLNTKFFKLIIDSETDIITTPFQEPIGQTVKTAKVLFMGNTICSNLRKLGSLWGISQSIVA